MKIFILEDDPERIAYFAVTFLNAGHTIDWAASCTQDNSFKGGYDLIFLDHDLGQRQMTDRSPCDHDWECVDDGEMTEWCLTCGAPVRFPAHRDNGLEFLKLIKDRIPEHATVVIHSYNPDGAKRMHDFYPEALVMPFKSPQFNSFVMGMLYGI